MARNGQTLNAVLGLKDKISGGALGSALERYL